MHKLTHLHTLTCTASTPESEPFCGRYQCAGRCCVIALLNARPRYKVHDAQVVARLGSLRALNGADVPPSERRDSELRYLRRVEGAR